MAGGGSAIIKAAKGRKCGSCAHHDGTYCIMHPEVGVCARSAVACYAWERKRKHKKVSIDDE